MLSSPSGAGKTTLAKSLLSSDENIQMSVSATTRMPRAREIDGVDYHFVSEEKFAQLIESDELLEYAQVFTNLYGTPKKAVEDLLSQGKDVLFDIDWQGAQQLHEKMREDMVRVFILPPCVEELEQRLRKRAQDNDETIAFRMSRARQEMSHWPEYEYVIINDDFDTALSQLKSILIAERQKKSRYTGLNEFVRGLTNDVST